MAKTVTISRQAKIVIIIALVVLVLLCIVLVVTFDPGTYYFDAGPPF